MGRAVLYSPHGGVLAPSVPPEAAPVLGPQLGPVRLPPPSDLPQWQAWAARLWGAPNEFVSWLHLDWYDDEGINRLVLWQITPIQQCTAFFKDFLLGPPPTRGAKGGGMIRLQWELGQRLHGWAQVYWIIQGARGGHKRRFTDVERNLLTLAGKPCDAPVAGDLPYAPFDERVVAQVARHDQIAQWNKMQEFAERRPDQLDADDQETMRGLRAEHLKWLERQVDAVFDSVTRADLVSATHATMSHDAQPIDWGAATHELITRDV